MRQTFSLLEITDSRTNSISDRNATCVRFNLWPLFKMEVYTAIYNGLILNLWNKGPYFIIIHIILVSVLDKVSQIQTVLFLQAKSQNQLSVCLHLLPHT